MASNKTPFNIRLMRLDERRLARVPRIRSADTYNGLKGEFHPEGLFSTVLLGDIGTTARDYTFGVIKLNTEIIHPYVCQWIKKLKRYYENIWMGTAYAIFDETNGEFIPSDFENGQTGYHFFISHLHQLKFKRNKSVKRNTLIDNFEQYQDRLTMKYYLVLPAGLRDLVEDSQGKVTEDEVNEKYRKLIRLASTFEYGGGDSESGNTVRVTMQITANEIYQYFASLLSGKKGFLLGKWGSRNLHLGTRNVISSMDHSAEVLGGDNAPTLDTIQVSLYQMMRGAFPLVVYLIRNNDLYQQSFGNTQYARLINPNTLEKETIELTDDVRDKWLSIEGIQGIIDFFEKVEVRNRPIIIQGHYLGLIYKDDKKYQVLNDISELPAGWDPKYVKPITYFEFFYLSLYKRFNQCYATCTRYPVTSDKSIYVGNVYIKTTTTYSKKAEYVDGKPTGDIAYEYPDLTNPVYIQSLYLSHGVLSNLSADFDGDKCTFNVTLTKEAEEECKRLGGLRSAVLETSGKLKFDVGVGPVTRVVNAFSRPMGQVRSKRSSV